MSFGDEATCEESSVKTVCFLLVLYEVSSLVRSGLLAGTRGCTPAAVGFPRAEGEASQSQAARGVDAAHLFLLADVASLEYLHDAEDAVQGCYGC